MSPVAHKSKYYKAPVSRSARKRETMILAREMGWKGKTYGKAAAFFRQLERERKAV